MSISTLDLDVRAYLDAVAARLVDLPEDERRDLLDDLHQHLLEVAADGEGTLRDRLGPPERYADELRASADLSPAPGGDGLVRRLAHRIERSSPVRAATALRRSRAMQNLAHALPELRPGLWVLRGYAAVSFGAIVTHGGYAAYRNGRASVLDVVAPHLFGSRAAGVALALIAAWVSLSLGRRGTSEPRARRLSILGTVATIAVAVVALQAARNAFIYTFVAQDVPEYLQHADGSTIENVCPYGPDGKLLSGVLLFDHRGRAIRNVPTTDAVGAEGEPLPHRVPAIENAYPRPMVVYDEVTGQMKPFMCPDATAPAAPEGSATTTPGGAPPEASSPVSPSRAP